MATFAVDNELPAGAATVHIKYTGHLNDKLRGFYLSTYNGRKYEVSQMEATDARVAFPCFDEPDYKATFDMTAIVGQGRHRNLQRQGCFRHSWPWRQAHHQVLHLTQDVELPGGADRGRLEVRFRFGRWRRAQRLHRSWQGERNALRAGRPPRRSCTTTTTTTR